MDAACKYLFYSQYVVLHPIIITSVLTGPYRRGVLGGGGGAAPPKFTILRNIRKIRSYSEISLKL